MTAHRAPLDSDRIRGYGSDVGGGGWPVSEPQNTESTMNTVRFYSYYFAFRVGG